MDGGVWRPVSGSNSLNDRVKLPQSNLFTTPDVKKFRKHYSALLFVVKLETSGLIRSLQQTTNGGGGVYPAVRKDSG